MVVQAAPGPPYRNGFGYAVVPDERDHFFNVPVAVIPLLDAVWEIQWRLRRHFPIEERIQNACLVLQRNTKLIAMVEPPVYCAI